MYLDYSKIPFDHFGRPETPTLFLQTLSEDTIGVIPGVSNLSIRVKFAEPSEIEFDVSSKIDVGGEFVDNPIFDKLTGQRVIHTKVYGNYIIINPEDNNDGIKDTIHIQAYSLEKHWEKKILFLEEGTFNFWNPVDGENTILGRMLELMPEWSVGYVSPTLVGKYRTFDEYDDYLLDFAYNTIPEKYRCVCVFDTYEKTISAYDVDEQYDTIPIYLDFDNLLTETNVNELTDELVTAISPYGEDNLSIRDVNPIGTNWIYNLDYFISNGDIPTGLAAKWNSWQAEIANRRQAYYGLVALKNSKSSQLMAEQAALVDMQGILTGYENQKSIIIQAIGMEITDEGKQYQEEQLEEVNRLISDQELAINDKKTTIQNIQDDIDSFNDDILGIIATMKFSEYFTEEEQNTLSNYFIEQTITEETFVSQDFSSSGMESIASGSTSGNIAITGSHVTKIKLDPEYDKTMYTFEGGNLAHSGEFDIDGDIIRATLEIGETTDDFIFTAHMGKVTIDDTSKDSAIITFIGKEENETDDIASVYDGDVEYLEGTSLSFDSLAETSLYASANVGEFERYSVQLELYDYAVDTLKDLASPAYEFTIESGNFVFAQEFEAFRNELQLGRGIHLNLGRGEVITPYLIELGISFEDHEELDLVFSSRFKRHDQVNTLKDMIEKSYSSSRSFDASRYTYNQTVNKQSEVDKFMSGELDAAKNTILAAADQSVVIDGAGIRVNGNITDGQSNKDIELRIVNGMIAMSDDNWNTAKLAMGYFKDSNGSHYGVNADVIAGKLLIGNNLVIENETDQGVMQFKVDQSGAWLYNSQFMLQSEDGGSMMLHPDYGFAAGSGSIYNTSGTTVTPTFIDSETGEIVDEDDDGYPDDVNFYIDMDGNVYLKGKIKAESGDIGGWKIDGNTLYSRTGDSDSTYVALNASGSDNALYAIWAGDDNPGSAPFFVKRDGTVRIQNGDFSGDLSAATGTFAGVVSGGSININDNFIVDENGNVVLNGNITWGPGSNPPVSQIYALYSQVNSSKPIGNYETFPSTSSSSWHKTLDADNDSHTSYSYDGGKTWTDGIKTRGRDGQDGSGATVTRAAIVQAMLQAESGDGLYTYTIDGNRYLGVNATAMQTGIIASKTNPTANYWNLDTGEFHVSGNSISITAGDAVSNAIDSSVNSGISTANSYTDSQIDDLEIGGRNLILGTANSKTSASSSSESSYTDYWYYSAYGQENFKGNIIDKFTVSFDYEITGGASGSSGRTPYIYTQINGTAWGPNISISENETGHYTQSGVLKSSQASYASDFRLRIRLQYAANGSTVKISNLKLERGTKATDWTPAPEDIESSVDALNVWKNTTYANDIQNIEGQIDKKIDTFYQADDPSDEWSASEKTGHKGDLWYNTTNQKTFQWDGTEWNEMTATPPDTVFNQIDGKAQIFVATPTPPYNVGDLWVQGSSGDILKCKTAKTKTQSYAASDWELASKYTDDSALNTWRNGDYKTTIEAIQGQVDSKADTYYQAGDPSDDWTAQEKPDHIGDLWYDTVNGISKMWNGITWAESDVPQGVYDQIDGKAQIFVGSTTPSNASNGDLWFKSASDPIKTYVNNQWVEYNKYTDDSSLNTFINGDFRTTIDNVRGQIDGKAETYYQSTDPKNNWAQADYSEHEGDLWYCTDTSSNKYQKYFRFNGTSWEEMTANPPSTVFDEIDGKAQIFAGATTPVGARERDLWFPGENEPILTFVNNQWVEYNKYTDDTALHNLVIGGRNLMLNTLVPDVSKASNRPKIINQDVDTVVSGNTTLTAVNHGIRLTTTKAVYPYIRFGNSTIGSATMTGLQAGQTYTLSFDAAFRLYSGSPASSTTYYYRLYLYTASSTATSWTNSDYYTVYTYATSDTSDRGAEHTARVEWTFTVPTSASKCYIILRPSGTTNSLHATGDYLEFANLKLEKGGKATDWTPAPEDLEAYTNGQLTEYAATISDSIDSLQAQIDGQIETYYYDYEPTLSNVPANAWVSADDKAAHEGDLFFWKSKGYAYRFMNDNGTWKWTLVQDTDITLALTNAADALDLADHKRRVFISQPTPPYDVGDLWTAGANGDILTCTTAKASGGSYALSDWTKLNKYTDDTALNNFVNGSYASTIQSIRGQIDKKVDTYYQTDDPSDDWTTDELLEHEGDLWYDSTTNVQKYYRWSGSAWQELTATPPRAVFDKIDGKAQIYIGATTPSSPSEGDLWFKGQDEPILSYVNGSWVEYNKYTNIVENLEIGGRNILRNTKDYDGWVLASGVTLTESIPTYIINFPSNSSGVVYAAGPSKTQLLPYSIIRDKKVVYSCYVKSSAATECELYVEYDIHSEQGGSRQKYTNRSFSFTPDGSWQKLIVSLDISDDIFRNGTGTVDFNSCLFRALLYKTDACPNAIQVKEIKLEIGDKATDWSPAPEDIEEEIASVRSYVDTVTDGIGEQIDGISEQWFYSGEPTASNQPASSWTTNDLKDAHVGDWYYDVKNGYAYRYTKSGSTYSWTKTTDSGVQDALANASKAQDTADNKRRVFVAQPTPPYDIGDLWVEGANGDIKRCKTKKASGSYSASDWVLASKYTDDSAFTAFRDGTYASFVTSTNQGIAAKTTTFYQNGQPTGATSGDLWIDTDDGNKLYRYDGSSWTSVQDTSIQTALAKAQNAQTTADGKIMTYSQTSQPTGDLDTGDLWIDTDDNNKLYRWSGSAWVPVTDSSAVENLVLGGGNILRWSDFSKCETITSNAEWSTGGFTMSSNGNATVSLVSTNDAPVPVSKAFRFVGSTSGNKDIQQRNIPLEANTDYTFSAYIRIISGTTANILSRFWDRAGNKAVQSTATELTGTGWQRFAITKNTGTMTNGKYDFSIGVTGTSADIEICAPQLEIGTKNTTWGLSSWDRQEEVAEINNWIENDFQDTIDSVLGQIDGKADTWYQEDDPSTTPAPGWNTTDLKAAHEGDLWYCTDSTNATRYKKVWRWTVSNNVYSWQEISSVPDDVFDQIDGKAQIFTGATLPSGATPNEGDLWFKGVDEPILSYVNGTWVEYNKYTNIVENLEIGGRNLLQDTDAPSLTKVAAGHNRYFSNSSVTAVVPSFVTLSDAPINVTNGTEFVVATGGTSTGRCLCWYSGNGRVPLVDGEEYTMSCYARVTSGTKMRLMFLYGIGTYDRVTIDITNTEWQRYSYTFRYDAAAYGDTNNTGNRVYMGFYADYAGTAQLCGYQLEKGNKATDWTLAPEDVSYAISTAQSSADSALAKFGTCDIAAGTVAKTVTSPTFTLSNGAAISVLFKYTNTAANPTLNVNGTGAKPIKYYDPNTNTLTALAADSYYNWVANSTIDFKYDSSNSCWVMQDNSHLLSQTQTFNSLTKGQSNQGIYLDNGNVYVNASFIKAGYISGDYIDAGAIKGNHIEGGTITADKLNANVLTSGHIKLYGDMNVYKDETDLVSTDNIGGKIGYAEGNDGTKTTRGIRMSNKNETFYFIATDSGVRMTANGASPKDIYVAEDGPVMRFDANKRVSVTSDGPGMSFISTANVTTRVEVHAGSFVPTSTGVVHLGTNGLKWADVYASTGTIQTSDRKQKYDINYNIDKYVEIFDLLKPASYKLIDGQSGRTHLGMIAQDIESSMNYLDIDSMDFAAFIKERVGNEDIYGLRYEEFIPILIAKIKQQQEQIDELSKKVNDME